MNKLKQNSWRFVREPLVLRYCFFLFFLKSGSSIPLFDHNVIPWDRKRKEQICVVSSKSVVQVVEEWVCIYAEIDGGPPLSRGRGEGIWWLAKMDEIENRLRRISSTLIYSGIYIGYNKKTQKKKRSTIPGKKVRDGLVQMGTTKKTKQFRCPSKWTCIVLLGRNSSGCDS